MILYQFMSAKHAITTLDEQVLKVSQFGNLNDPFELHAAGYGESEVRNILTEFASNISSQFRLICCSKSWGSPLLWGHYADSHRGIALVLEVADDLVNNIDYINQRIKIDSSDLQLDKSGNSQLSAQGYKILFSKYDQWSYEDEARIMVKADKIAKYGGLEFVRLKKNISLVGMILGPLNETTENTISKAIPKNEQIYVTKAMLASQAYDVVEDANYANVTVKSLKE